MIMENVGGKIYNLRVQKKVSQEELAEAVNVARPTISRWENNTVIPTTENIKKLCSFFGVGINYFLSEEEIALVSEKEEVKKQHKFKTLKTVFAVIGIVLLVLCVIVCGIAAYVTIEPNGSGYYVSSVHSINYAGIIFLVTGILAVAVLITLTVIFIKKHIKKRKKK